jgi:hypothetical protein
MLPHADSSNYRQKQHLAAFTTCRLTQSQLSARTYVEQGTCMVVGVEHGSVLAPSVARGDGMVGEGVVGCVRAPVDPPAMPSGAGKVN